jgi:hypothetical protein
MLPSGTKRTDWGGSTAREKRISGSIAALFQRLMQGVYVVGLAHGETQERLAKELLDRKQK